MTKHSLKSYSQKYGEVDLAIQELKQLLGEKLVVSAAIRKQHGGGEVTYHKSMAPDAVAFANATSEVSEIVKICAKYLVPIIPYGAGSSLEGQVSAIYGGICIYPSYLELQDFSGSLNAQVQGIYCRQWLFPYQNK